MKKKRCEWESSFLKLIATETLFKCYRHKTNKCMGLNIFRNNLSKCFISFFYSRVPSDIASIVYAVGIKEGDENVWDYVLKQSRLTRTVSDAEILMSALCHTRQTWLLWRSLLLLSLLINSITICKRFFYY